MNAIEYHDMLCRVIKIEVFLREFMNKLNKFFRVRMGMYCAFVLQMTLQALASDALAMENLFHSLGKSLRDISEPAASELGKKLISEIPALAKTHEEICRFRDECVIPSLKDFDEKHNLNQKTSPELEAKLEAIKGETAAMPQTEEPQQIMKMPSEFVAGNFRFKDSLSLEERLGLRKILISLYEKKDQQGRTSYETVREYFQAMNQLDQNYEPAITQTQENLSKIREFIQSVEVKDLDASQGALIQNAALIALDFLFGEEAGSPIVNELAVDVRNQLDFQKGSEKLLNLAEVMSISWAARTDSSLLSDDQIQKYKINFVITLARMICDRKGEGESPEVDFSIASRRFLCPCSETRFFTRSIRFLIQEKHPVLQSESTVSNSSPNDRSEGNENEWELVKDEV